MALELHPAAKQCRLLTQLDYIKQQTAVLGIRGHHVGLQSGDGGKRSVSQSRAEDDAALVELEKYVLFKGP